MMTPEELEDYNNCFHESDFDDCDDFDDTGHPGHPSNYGDN